MIKGSSYCNKKTQTAAQTGGRIVGDPSASLVSGSFDESPVRGGFTALRRPVGVTKCQMREAASGRGTAKASG